MRRLLIPLMVFAAVGLMLSIVGLVRTMNRMGSTPSQGGGPTIIQPDPASLGLSIPEFTLTDHNNQLSTQAIFDGRVTVLDFFFTHCPFICPMMMLEMKDRATALAGTGVRFVSISVDPTHDTPARLKEYAGEKELDLSRWTLLTGDAKTVETIAFKSLGFAIGPDKDASKTFEVPGGGTMQNIVHPNRLILVGPDRNVLGFYDFNNPEDMQKLTARAKAAAAALPK